MPTNQLSTSFLPDHARLTASATTALFWNFLLLSP